MPKTIKAITLDDMKWIPRGKLLFESILNFEK